jgi:hypothetical protein
MLLVLEVDVCPKCYFVEVCYTLPCMSALAACPAHRRLLDLNAPGTEWPALRHRCFSLCSARNYLVSEHFLSMFSWLSLSSPPAWSLFLRIAIFVVRKDNFFFAIVRFFYCTLSSHCQLLYLAALADFLWVAWAEVTAVNCRFSYQKGIRVPLRPSECVLKRCCIKNLMQIASVEVPMAVTVNIPTFWNVTSCYW